MIRKLLIVTTVTLIALLTTACRSRASKVVPPTTTPVVDVTPAATPAPAAETVVAEPSVRLLPRDAVELTRLAHQSGWIEDAFFDYERSALSDSAQQALSRSAAWLLEHRGVAVTIEGHCDERGTEQYNLALGDRRAQAARDYLVSLGIDDERIGTVSYGEQRPFAEGSHESAWSQNRRAHILVNPAKE